jgi:uncharacterized protein YcnI
MRAPTEGKVATTSVELEIPDGVVVLEVAESAGARHELRKEGERIVAIIWHAEIKPGEFREFSFVARNPRSGDRLVWKAHQRYADGTGADWAGPEGDRRPASVTRLTGSAGNE